MTSWTEAGLGWKWRRGDPGACTADAIAGCWRRYAILQSIGPLQGTMVGHRNELSLPSAYLLCHAGPALHAWLVGMTSGGCMLEDACWPPILWWQLKISGRCCAVQP